MLNFILRLNIKTWHWQARKQSVTTDVLIHSQCHALPASILTHWRLQSISVICIVKIMSVHYFLCLSFIEPLFSLSLIKLCLYASILKVSLKLLLVLVLNRAGTRTACYINSVLELPFLIAYLCVHIFLQQMRNKTSGGCEHRNRISVLFLQGREVNGKSIMSAINNPLNMREFKYGQQWLFKSFHSWGRKLCSEAVGCISHITQRRRLRTCSEHTHSCWWRQIADLCFERLDKVRGEEHFL